MQYTAVYQKQGSWYIGWVEEVPGVNSQGKTVSELKQYLKEALVLILEENRSLINRERPKGKIMRERVRVRV